MRFAVLGSGSRGNAVFVESGATAILIDAGFSGREIEARMAGIGRDPDCLEAIFVSHEHHDHVCGVGVLSRRLSIPVYANEKTFACGGKALARLFARHEFETGGLTGVGGLAVRSFAISHDSADPVGFVIEDDSSRLGICTDTGISTRLMSRRLSDCDALVLEFNHDPGMLKSGPYPQALKQRVNSNQGHLSNADGARLLEELVTRRLQHVVLAHLSETNNLPEIARAEAVQVLARTSAAAALEVSSQRTPTELFEIVR